MALYTLPKLFHPDFRRPGLKPLSSTEVDWSNPITIGLKALILYNGLEVVEVITRPQPTITGTLALDIVDGNKTTYVTDSASHYVGIDGDLANISSDQITVISKAKISSSSLNTNISKTVGNNSAWRLFNCLSTGTHRFRLFTGTGSQNLDSGLTPSTSQSEVVVGSYDGVNMRIYVDGVLANSVGKTENITTNSDPISTRAQSNGDAANFEYAAIWERCLSDAEIESLYADFYQLIRPAVPMFYFTSAGTPGSYTLIADAGSFAITGFDANLEHHRSLSADAGSFDITGFDATLTYEQPGVYILPADAGSYAITGFSANLIYSGSGNWQTQNPDTGIWTEQASTAAIWNKQNPT